MIAPLCTDCHLNDAYRDTGKCMPCLRKAFFLNPDAELHRQHNMSSTTAPAARAVRENGWSIAEKIRKLYREDTCEANVDRAVASLIEQYRKEIEAAACPKSH